MNLTSSLSSKGQVTIPQAVRERMGLHAGDKVEFIYEGGKIVLKTFQPQRPSFATWAGAFPAFDTAEEREAWLSDLRDDDDRKEDLRTAPS